MRGTEGGPPQFPADWPVAFRAVRAFLHTEQTCRPSKPMPQPIDGRGSESKNRSPNGPQNNFPATLAKHGSPPLAIHSCSLMKAVTASRAKARRYGENIMCIVL